MAVDMRSDSTEELLKLEGPGCSISSRMRCGKKTRRWNSDKIAVEIKTDRRPARRHRGDGIRRSFSGPRRRARVAVVTRRPRAVQLCGPPARIRNWAMSRAAFPPSTIGGGGEGGNWHSRNEWYKPVDAYFGPQNAAADDPDADGGSMG